jgi:hypothetical protein
MVVLLLAGLSAARYAMLRLIQLEIWWFYGMHDILCRDFIHHR